MAHEVTKVVGGALDAGVVRGEAALTALRGERVGPPWRCAAGRGRWAPRCRRGRGRAWRCSGGCCWAGTPDAQDPD
jgi:hypothetical protein